VPGRVHPLLPATPAPPPTRAAPSTAPTAPPVAPLPLPSDLAQMFDEPTGPGAAPAVPLSGSLVTTASSSSWPGRLISATPQGPVMAVSGTPAGVPWAGLVDWWQGKAKRANSSSASATSSSSSSWKLDETEVSDTPYVYTQLTYSHVRTGLLTYSPAHSIQVAVEEAMLEVDTSEAIEEVIEETIVESNAIVEAIEEAIEEVIEETIVESNATHA